VRGCWQCEGAGATLGVGLDNVIGGEGPAGQLGS
jgi:hypothetical protein